jgi:hypothetical protein
MLKFKQNAVGLNVAKNATVNIFAPEKKEFLTA